MQVTVGWLGSNACDTRYGQCGLAMALEPKCKSTNSWFAYLMFAAAAAWSARSQAFSMLHVPHFKKFTASQLRIIVIEAFYNASMRWSWRGGAIYKINTFRGTRLWSVDNVIFFHSIIGRSYKPSPKATSKSWYFHTPIKRRVPTRHCMCVYHLKSCRVQLWIKIVSYRIC